MHAALFTAQGHKTGFYFNAMKLESDYPALSKNYDLIPYELKDKIQKILTNYIDLAGYPVVENKSKEQAEQMLSELIQDILSDLSVIVYTRSNLTLNRLIFHKHKDQVTSEFQWGEY